MQILSKQKNSEMCMICGMNNNYGVKAQFYNMEDGSVMTPFVFREEHQSYPGRVHGGIITAMLDELGLRAYWVEHEDEFAVTMSLETKYRKPVPYGLELIGKGEIIRSTSKFLEAKAQILDMYGNVLATVEGKYIKMSTDKIMDEKDFHEGINFLIEDDRKEINFRK